MSKQKTLRTMTSRELVELREEKRDQEANVQEAFKMAQNIRTRWNFPMIIPDGYTEDLLSALRENEGIIHRDIHEINDELIWRINE